MIEQVMQEIRDRTIRLGRFGHFLDPFQTLILQACVCLRVLSSQGKSDGMAGIKMTSECHGSMKENRAEGETSKCLYHVGFPNG